MWEGRAGSQRALGLCPARCFLNVSLTEHQRHSPDNEGRGAVPSQTSDTAFVKFCVCVRVHVCSYIHAKYLQYALHTTSRKPWRKHRSILERKDAKDILLIHLIKN